MNPALRQTAGQVIRSHLDKVKGHVVTKKLFQLFEDTALRLANKQAKDCTKDLVACISCIRPVVTVSNALDGDDWSKDGRKLVCALEASLTRLGSPPKDLLEDAKREDIDNIKETKRIQDEQRARGPVPLLYSMPEKGQTSGKVDLMKNLTRLQCSKVKQYLLTYECITADIWITHYNRHMRTCKGRSWAFATDDQDVTGGLLYYVNVNEKRSYFVVLRQFISPPPPDGSGIPDGPFQCIHECRYKAVEYHSPGTKCPTCECFIDVPELVPRPTNTGWWSRSPKLIEHLTSHFSDGTVSNIFADGNTKLTTATFEDARDHWGNTLILEVQRPNDKAQSGKGKGKALVEVDPRSNHGSSSSGEADEQTNRHDCISIDYGGDDTVSIEMTLAHHYRMNVLERERNDDTDMVVD